MSEQDDVLNWTSSTKGEAVAPPSRPHLQIRKLGPQPGTLNNSPSNLTDQTGGDHHDSITGTGGYPLLHHAYGYV